MSNLLGISLDFKEEDALTPREHPGCMVEQENLRDGRKTRMNILPRRKTEINFNCVTDVL